MDTDAVAETVKSFEANISTESEDVSVLETLTESSEEEPQLSLKQRVMGMFAAHHLGDALGAPHEFRINKDAVYTGKLEIHPSRMRDARYFKEGERELIQPIGTVTDDTQMTKALLNMLIDEKGRYKRDEAILAYAGWAHSKPLDMGTNTRYIFTNKTVKGYESRMKKLQEEIEAGTKTISLSNGALMRCTPLALIGGLDNNKPWLKACKADVRLTNPYKISIQCNLVYLALLRDILRGSSVTDVLTLAQAIITEMKVEKEVELAVKQALNIKFKRDISGKDKGYCLHALYCSIRSLIMISNGSTYPKIMKWVITQGTKTGKGDTDTNAAISGALVGAYFGFDTLMLDKRTRKNWKVLQKAASKVKGSLKNYVPVDFEKSIDTYLTKVCR